MGHRRRRAGVAVPLLPMRGRPMRRLYWLAPAVLAAVTASVFVFHRTAVTAPREGAGTGTATAPALPISKVVLFSSGVGYFQRTGTVDGNARVDLTFQVRD